MMFYTKGKFGKAIRETLDTDNEYLYAQGKYKIKSLVSILLYSSE